MAELCRGLSIPPAEELGIRIDDERECLVVTDRSSGERWELGVQGGTCPPKTGPLEMLG